MNRREFLQKTAAVVGVGVAVPSVATSLGVNPVSAKMNVMQAEMLRGQVLVPLYAEHKGRAMLADMLQCRVCGAVVEYGGFSSGKSLHRYDHCPWG